MKLAEYSDDELLEEVKHRGFKIELVIPSNFEYIEDIGQIKIGGVIFDISNS